MVVYFSGKITNSVLHFLDHKGMSLEDLYEQMDLSFEFMKDPSAWLDADKVENFLEAVENRFSCKFPDEDLMTQIGHASFNLKAWGVLDSVLKMMQKPQDIYLQPQRFLSYFISPEVAIHSLDKAISSVKFDIAISSNDYPLITNYLSSALESLPQYVGRSMSTVNWNLGHVVVSWVDSESQRELLDKDEAFVHPQLLNSIVQSLEETQNELEKKNEELLQKMKENKKLKKDLENYVNQFAIKNLSMEPVSVLQNVSSDEVKSIKNEVVKLNDYFTRAQQLVTLLVAQGKMDKQARLAMKKMGWDNVLFEGPMSFKKAIQEIEKLQMQPNLFNTNQITSIHQ